MRPATFHFYRLDDGTFIGRTLTLTTDTDAQAFVALNTPPGCAALRHDGPLNAEASRVDLETRAVVEYQPPEPSPDHEWNAQARRWALKAAAVERRDRRTAALARIVELERQLVPEPCLLAARHPGQLRQ